MNNYYTTITLATHYLHYSRINVSMLFIFNVNIFFFSYLQKSLQLGREYTNIKYSECKPIENNSATSASSNKVQDLPRPPDDLPRQMYENLPLKERGHNNVGIPATRAPAPPASPPTPAPRNCIY